MTNLREQAELWAVADQDLKTPVPLNVESGVPNPSAPPPITSATPTTNLSYPRFAKLSYEIFLCKGKDEQAQKVKRALRDLGKPEQSMRTLPISVKARENFAPLSSPAQIRYMPGQKEQVDALALIRADPAFMSVALWSILPVSRKGNDVMQFLVCSQPNSFY